MHKLLFVALLSLSWVASAAETARAQLDAFATGLNSLRGTFVQQVYGADDRPGEMSKGSLALQAPRQFRWDYEEPFPQLIVADTTNVWIWDKDLDQVTVRAQSLEESQSPLTVLTDLSQLDREYTSKEQGTRDGIAWLRLTPTAKEPSFTHCELGFSDGALSRMVLTDTLGQRNELRFGRWERNPKLDPELFRFTVPEGVDVIGEPVDNAEAFPVTE